MRDSPLVDYLLEHREDRAMLAALRRGLGHTLGTPPMYPYVVRFLPNDPFRARQEAWRYFTVATLFGFHPLHNQGVSIGGAMARLDRNDSLEKRFVWLLDASIEELPMRLKSIVSLLKSNKIGFDFQKLFYDLGYWSHSDRFVQLHWAQDFYKITYHYEKE